MGALNEFLQTKGIYTLVMILFFLGVYGMVLSKNYMKKLMAMNVMQVAVIFFFLCLGQKEGGMIPIFDPAVTDAASYINPLPHCLMLTAIVVSLGTTGLAFALLCGQAHPKFNKKTSKYLLQYSVVGLGFGMNLQASLASGKEGMEFTIISVIGTLLIGWVIGRKFLKVDRDTS